MFRLLPPAVRGAIAAILLAFDTLLWCSMLFAVALLKLLVPATGFRAALDGALNVIATRWISGNSAWMRATQRTDWDVAGFENLAYGGWYLVDCNHQSWVDILVLQHLLNRWIPMLKFFLKRQLIYVPAMGFAWWALDFPLARRGAPARSSAGYRHR
jgi:1-acyl-sn-glycerol-3-phosphate acyltransferase